MNWTHGTPGFLLLFGFTALGTLIGLLSGKATIGKLIAFPLTSVPIFLVVLVVGAVLEEWILPHLGISRMAEPVLTAVIIDAFCLLTGSLFGWIASLRPSGPEHTRGTVLQAATEPLRARPRANGLTLAGQPLRPRDETKHFKLIGTTGTGKSTAVRELLQGALERGDRAVIADPDGCYLQRFYDLKRGDVILNPFDPQAARWDLFAEMHTVYDADQLARSLIVDTEGPERNWRTYARVFLSAVLRQLHRVEHHDPAELYQLLSSTPVQDLRELLEDTPAGPYLAQDNGKFFGAVRAVANTHLSALEHVARQTRGQRLSVREWVKGGGRGCLFLPYQANEIATLRSLISTWIRLAIFETMSQPTAVGEIDQRLWFVIDELDALGPIDGLKDALARLRKFGGRCVLGFQSIAQVSGTYGRAEAQTIVENCGNTLILRCSASEGGGTARFASSLIGDREITRQHVTENDGGGLFSRRNASTSTSLQHVTEAAVLPSEIEQLPDLQGYLKFASQREWRRVRLHAPNARE